MVVVSPAAQTVETITNLPRDERTRAVDDDGVPVAAGGASDGEKQASIAAQAVEAGGDYGGGGGFLGLGLSQVECGGGGAGGEEGGEEGGRNVGTGDVDEVEEVDVVEGEEFLMTQVSVVAEEQNGEREFGMFAERDWPGLGIEEEIEARDGRRWARARDRGSGKRLREDEEEDEGSVVVLSDDDESKDDDDESNDGDEADEKDEVAGEDWEVRSPSCSPPESPARGGEEELQAVVGARVRARRRTSVIVLDDFDFGEVEEVDVAEVEEKEAENGDAVEVFEDENVVEVDCGPESSGARAGGEEGSVVADIGLEGLRTVYHVRSFDLVVDSVLTRYEGILRQPEVDLVRTYRSLKPCTRSLFVRLYRRVPAWHGVQSLAERYNGDWDVGADRKIAEMVEECVRCGLLATTKIQRSQRVVEEVLRSLTIERLKDLCRFIIDGKALMRKGRDMIVAGLLRVLRGTGEAVVEAGGRSKKRGDAADRGRLKKRMRQTTINGSDPKERLFQKIMQEERVAIPPFVRASLRRVNFLFFFDDNDGGESPWVMLADVGRVRFANYKCVRTRDVFESGMAYSDYESARGLELGVEGAVNRNDWECALSLGAQAEVAILEFARLRGLSLNANRRTNSSQTSSAGRDAGVMSSLYISQRVPASRVRGPEHAAETERALAHPFYRRFSTPVKYARACWRSVRALEAEKEYITAVSRIKLLLATELLPAHTGRMLDRLSVDLNHLGLFQQALDLISSSLSSSEFLLHRGEVAGLARRGAAIHKKIRTPIELDAVPDTVKTKVARKRAADEAVSNSIPRLIGSTLRKLRTSVPVRMLRGKALPSKVLPPARGRNAQSLSGDSVDKGELPKGDSGRLVGVKSRFVGLACDSLDVSVEELGLEWYAAHKGWSGAHSEGSALRFIWCLLLWDSIYAPVADVFQSPYQDKPWDLYTEVFYTSRRTLIDARLAEIRAWSPTDVAAFVTKSYNDEAHHKVLCVGGAWDTFSAEDLSCIGAGLGGRALAHISRLLCTDYKYWSGGLPDLVLWRWASRNKEDSAGIGGESLKPLAKLVEVKSQRDVLSTKQRAWLSELLDVNVDCEVFKVVEKETTRNSESLLDSELDAMQLRRLDIEDVGGADEE